ncbi:MAG: ROK family protein [Betaproteobacteria bacterium]
MTDTASGLVFGVDLGATKILGGAFTPAPELLGTEQRPAQGSEGASRVVENLLLVLEALRERYGAPAAIGIGAAGQIEWPAGRVLSSGGTIRGWAGTDLRRTVSARFGCSVVVDNDANAAALAEQRLGAGHGARCVVCVTLGTGIGTGVVVDGAVLRGARGVAAEFGHTTVNFEGPRCSCGRRGCLEAYASGRGLAGRYLDRTGRSVSGADEVFTAAVGGDPEAASVIGEASAALGEGLANLAMAYNPDVILLSGGMSARWDELVRPAVEHMRSAGLRANLEEVKVLPARLGPAAGLHGAALLAIEEVFGQ